MLRSQPTRTWALSEAPNGTPSYVSATSALIATLCYLTIVVCVTWWLREISLFHRAQHRITSCSCFRDILAMCAPLILIDLSTECYRCSKSLFFHFSLSSRFLSLPYNTYYSLISAKRTPKFLRKAQANTQLKLVSASSDTTIAALCELRARLREVAKFYPA